MPSGMSHNDEVALTYAKDLVQNNTATQFTFAELVARFRASNDQSGETNILNRIERLITSGHIAPAKYSVTQAGVDYIPQT